MKDKETEWRMIDSATIKQTQNLLAIIIIKRMMMMIIIIMTSEIMKVIIIMTGVKLHHYTC